MCFTENFIEYNTLIVTQVVYNNHYFCSLNINKIKNEKSIVIYGVI
ncbi:hypothetical protein T190607A02C_220021 [Tenacibaculum sp. 190524A02b]